MHPFLLRFLDLVRVGGQLGSRAPVDDGHLVSSESHRLARDVDRSVAAADHDDAPADVRCPPRLEGLDERQRLPDAGELVPGIAHVGVVAHADGEEDCVDVLGNRAQASGPSILVASLNSTPSARSARASAGRG